MYCTQKTKMKKKRPGKTTNSGTRKTMQAREGDRICDLFSYDEVGQLGRLNLSTQFQTWI